MVKSILKIIVLIVAVIGGAVGASFYKSVNAPAAASHSPEKGEDAKKGEDKKGEDAQDLSNKRYQKFKRQFIIPVMKERKIESLVIMNFNLELNDKAPSNSFSLEPKLRDAFMRDLLNLSNEGIFDTDLTSPETYEETRGTLLGSSRRILNDGVDDILILDIAKRDA